MKIYNGIDICSIERIGNVYNKWGNKFLNKIFTLQELQEAKSVKNSKIDYNINYLTKRFAAKEAFAKATGEGIGNISFKDISVNKNKKGAPYINLSNKAIDYLLKTKNWLEYDLSVSLSDDKGLVIASVVILVKN